jgi:hypothetical protein
MIFARTQSLPRSSPLIPGQHDLSLSSLEQAYWWRPLHGKYNISVAQLSVGQVRNQGHSGSFSWPSCITPSRRGNAGLSEPGQAVVSDADVSLSSDIFLVFMLVLAELSCRRSDRLDVYVTRQFIIGRNPITAEGEVVLQPEA